MELVPTVGLEIHAELKTQTKMFCNSKNDTDEVRPNVNICPVCLAHPGTLPVINGEAVRHVLRVGIALGSRLADYTEFDRKNYFYPDLPKGYQLSQYAYPLVSGGELKGVAITRVHLEEDTARSIHNEETGETLIDFNRAGVPLMELVTEPVITSAQQAGEFARELQLLLRTLGASNADMEKGEMRVEANISVAEPGKRGTKVEIKNLNSFRIMERAVAHEIERQSALLREGKTVVQETRGWDDAKQETFAQRLKEGSADYRYFPDPDLPSLTLSEVPEYGHERLQAFMPELPEARRRRYADLGVRAEDIEQYVRDEALGGFFDAVVREMPNDRELAVLASNYIANDLVKLIRDSDIRDTETRPEIPISARNFSKLMAMIKDGVVSSRGGKDLVAIMMNDARPPEEIAAAHSLLQTTSLGDIEAVVDSVIGEYAAVAAEYRDGKGAAIQFLVGQCMKALKGSGNPSLVLQALKQKLDA